MFQFSGRYTKKPSDVIISEKSVDVQIQDENREEGCYQLGCRLAKEVAVRYLESKAVELDKQRPDGYRVKNTNPRTLVTRFGDVKTACIPSATCDRIP